MISLVFHFVRAMPLEHNNSSVYIVLGFESPNINYSLFSSLISYHAATVCENLIGCWADMTCFVDSENLGVITKKTFTGYCLVIILIIWIRSNMNPSFCAIYQQCALPWLSLIKDFLLSSSELVWLCILPMTQVKHYYCPCISEQTTSMLKWSLHNVSTHKIPFAYLAKIISFYLINIHRGTDMLSIWGAADIRVFREDKPCTVCAPPNLPPLPSP